jgi:hypothetical protein
MLIFGVLLVLLLSRLWMDLKSHGELVALMPKKPVNQYQMVDFPTPLKDALTLEAFSTEWDSQIRKSLHFQVRTLSACATQTEVALLDHGLQRL